MANDPKNTIAFQGVAGAHSDVACKHAYPYMHTLPCETFEDAFAAVETGKAALAHIPIENSSAGRVAEIHNILPHTGLSIVSEYFHKVRHNLLGLKSANLKDIKTAYSHPQALMQCRKSCLALGLRQEPYFDTAAAAKAVSEWGDVSRGAIASDLAAELYGLQVLKADMQDNPRNTTHFVAFAKAPLDLDPAKEKHVLTSMIFTTRNIAAGLYKALGGFATNGVNLLKLESYVPDYNSGTAQFFITFEGHPEQKHVQHALEELGFFTKNVRLLGVYPADRSRYKA